ncbi:hypothetical protein PAXRUDRAFT_141293, partial [Paxillus rubicundulus Ve08.2h10]
DPNLAVEPDFNTEEYAQERLELVDAQHSIADDFTTQLLSRTWRLNNTKDTHIWTVHIEEQNRLAAAKEEAECTRIADEERQAALKEERQKNKAKFSPVHNIDVPDNPFTLPSQYATCQLKKGTYCPLFYFTNKGLRKASQVSFTNDSEALVLVQGEHGSHSFLPALSAQPISPSFIKDKHLTWEQFGESTLRMIISMCNHEWPNDHVNMHISFWSTIQTHP